MPKQSDDADILAFLLAALGGKGARCAPDASQAEGIARLAIAHRVHMALLRRWGAMAADHGWPPAPRALQDEVHKAKARSLRGASWMGQLSQALAGAGIAHLGMKGPLLAMQAYRDPSARPFRDIDFWVPPTRFEAAVAVAEGLGWHAPAGWHKVHALAGKFDLELMGGQPLQPILEIGTQAFGGHMRTPPLAELAADKIPLGQTAVPTLELPDQIAYVALHGAKHLWARLIWLVDLADLLSLPDVDCQAVVIRARAWGGEAAIHAGVDLCRTVLGRTVSFPSPASPALARSSRRIARWTHDRMAIGPDGAETFVLHCRERLVSDRWLRAFARSAFDFARPAEVDARALGLDKPAALHFVARPLFWLRRAIRRIERH